jgi:aconitate hydratase
MSSNVAQKLIQAHLVHGAMKQGEEIGIRIDQTLTQDATGTLVMLELESMSLDRVKTEVSVQYVDHNIVQADFKNAKTIFSYVARASASACGFPVLAMA